MNSSDFENISMNGRMAYIILCIETYLLAKFPEEDWSILSQWMWAATSSYWDEWDGKFIEIIPEDLFEFSSYEESDFEQLTKEEYDYFTKCFRDKPEDLNQLMLKPHELQVIYSYTCIPKHGQEAIDIVLEVCSILEKNKIPLPDIQLVQFSSFSEKDGWGEDFDGTKLSLILRKKVKISFQN